MVRLISDEIRKLLEVLVGSTSPVADTTIDDMITQNVDTLIDISYWAVQKLYCTSKYRTSPYHSSKEIGEKAYLAMMDLKEYFEDEEEE